MVSDTLEIYEDGQQRPFAIIRSSFQPAEADLISIRGVTWLVIGRSFSIDRAGEADQSIRCNVIVQAAARSATRIDQGDQ